MGNFLWKISKHSCLQPGRCWLFFLADHFWLPHSMLSWVVLRGKVPLILQVLNSLDQTYSSILSRWSNHCSLLSRKDYLMLCNFSLLLHSSAEILSSGPTLHIHSATLASFVSSLIWSSFTGLVSLPYSIKLRTHVEYNLPFFPKGKPLMANNDTKSSEPTPSTPYPCFNTINCNPSSYYYVKKIKPFPNFKRLAI